VASPKSKPWWILWVHASCYYVLSNNFLSMFSEAIGIVKQHMISWIIIQFTSSYVTLFKSQFFCSNVCWFWGYQQKLGNYDEGWEHYILCDLHFKRLWLHPFEFCFVWIKQIGHMCIHVNSKYDVLLISPQMWAIHNCYEWMVVHIYFSNKLFLMKWKCTNVFKLDIKQIIITTLCIYQRTMGTNGRS